MSHKRNTVLLGPLWLILGGELACRERLLCVVVAVRRRTLREQTSLLILETINKSTSLLV